MNVNVTLSAVINTTVALPCDIILDLTVTFTWQFDGVNLDPSTSEGMYEILPNGSLVISDVTESHEGTYTCVATNSLGVASGNVLLTVNSKLTIILLSLLTRMGNVKCGIKICQPCYTFNIIIMEIIASSLPQFLYLCLGAHAQRSIR